MLLWLQYLLLTFSSSISKFNEFNFIIIYTNPLKIMPPLPNNEFIVRQSILINSLLLSFFLLISLGLVFTFLSDSEHSFLLYLKPLVAVICLLIIAAVNVKRRRVIYRINNTGIYYYESLISTWKNFYIAYVSDDSNSSNINDDIRLVIQYYDSNRQLMEIRLPASPTLEKDVYEIVDAIVKYHPSI